MGKGPRSRVELNSKSSHNIPVVRSREQLLDLSETLDSLVEPFLVLDNQGRLLYFNQATELLFGISTEMLGKKPDELFFRFNPQLNQNLDQAIREKVSLHFEVEIQDTWYEVRYYPSKDKHLLRFYDISKNKHLEFELQQSLHRFTASIDNMLGSFVILSAIRDESSLIKDFVIEFINRAACSRRKLKAQDIIGRTLFEVYPGHRNSELFVNYVRVVETGKPLFLESIFYEDKLFSGFFDVQAVQMGDGIALSWNDVSHRQLAEEALRLSEERFYKAFHLNPATMSIARVSDGSYIDVNRRWSEATGYTADEVIGKNPVELSLWVADNYCNEFRSVFSSKGVVYGMEGQVRTKSGKIITGHLSAEVINMNGELCWLTVFQDTTEKQLLEKHLARLDRLNLIGEIAASMGHEIRNPLTSVRGFLQLIEESEEGANLNDYFNIILEELDRANFILSEFLLLAKDRAIDPHPHDINSIIKAICPLLQADATRSEKVIELQLESVPLVNLDDKEIRQLVVNLARNGLEAMDPGGILTISTCFDKGKVVLAVKDTGKGIAADLLDKLGTPFVTNKDDGAGLALAVCYSIVARHRAQLSFDTSSEGTTFRVQFHPAE